MGVPVLRLAEAKTGHRHEHSAKANDGPGDADSLLPEREVGVLVTEQVWLERDYMTLRLF